MEAELRRRKHAGYPCISGTLPSSSSHLEMRMRHFLFALVGAIVVFMWGFTAWAALGIYDFAFPTTTNEVAILDVLGANLTEDGAYMLPSMPVGYGTETTDPAKQAEFASFETRLSNGPVALVMYHKSGMQPTEPMELARGFGIEFVSAIMLTCILSTVTGGMGRKAFVGFTIALFSATACYGVMGNFMHLPLPFVMAFWFDAIVAWTLCSVVIAAMQTRYCKNYDAGSAAANS